MKAIVLRSIGGPELLSLEEAPDPVPGAGEVVVQLKAAALNHRDVWIRTGKYAGIMLPIIPGSDGAGTVSSVGAGVDISLIGHEVIINPAMQWGPSTRYQGGQFQILGLPQNGTYAEYVKVPVENIFPKPKWLSFQEAAAVPLAGVTAYRATVTRAQVSAGETVVITGIGGGVATFALMIAKQRHARVFVTSGSDTKLERAAALGADGGVNYKNSTWVKELAAKAGYVDVVIDGAGGAVFDSALDLLSPGGRIAIYGATAGPVHELQVRRIFWKQLTVLGSTMGSPHDFEEMLSLFGKDGLRPVIDSVHPLERATDAHRRMEEHEQFGKIVLAIA
jgi:NADPH:quinone reductase-like Zn-dependent oxidoreductase